MHVGLLTYLLNQNILWCSCSRSNYKTNACNLFTIPFMELTWTNFKTRIQCFIKRPKIPSWTRRTWERKDGGVLSIIYVDDTLAIINRNAESRFLSVLNDVFPEIGGGGLQLTAFRCSSHATTGRKVLTMVFGNVPHTNRTVTVLVRTRWRVSVCHLDE